ncbi:MAG: glycosyltransferase [Acidimicrobiales bacterium]|nr:glycosyltransferase [Acidimicrobiales bacterium]
MITVIVPAYNAAPVLRRCLKSIREATSEQLELIVVDDASTDATVECCEGLADIVVRRKQRGGAAVARNEGRRHGSGDRLVFIDADVEPEPGSIDVLLTGLAPGYDAAFGSYTALPPTGLRGAATRYKNFLHHFTHQRSQPEVATFWAGFGAVRAEAFDAVGGFPERAIRFADVEDIRLGYALTEAGHRVRVVPGAQALHHKPFTVAGLIRTDLVHRAIPWVDAALRSRSFRPELAVAPRAILSSLAAWTALVATMAVVVGGGWIPAAVAGLGLVAWLALNGPFLAAAYRAMGSVRQTAPLAALHVAFSWYAPLGAAAGLLAHVVGRARAKRR